MTQEAKEKALKKLKKNKIDYSLISFNVIFEPEHFGEPLEMSFRYQSFRELRDWGKIISPSSNIHPGDRSEELLKQLKGCLLSPSGNDFEKWLDILVEPDFKRFIREYGEAKGAEQKK